METSVIEIIRIKMIRILTKYCISSTLPLVSYDLGLNYNRQRDFMALVRYGKITNSLEKREIVLLRAFPCKWGRCSFCTYIDDNSTDEDAINKTNFKVLEMVTGEFEVLEVINSGSCFEIPTATLEFLKVIVVAKKIRKLYFEAHWSYRHRLDEFRNFFCVPITFITGIETFDDDFRNRVLKKGIAFKDIDEVKSYFQSICLMVGIEGQTKDMISRDIDILVKNFDHGTVNLFVENESGIKPDLELQKWFRENYAWLENEKKIDVLWKNTDFGVGAEESESSR